jgi:bisphosphoglycerate-independent phosphoglycerate mutase (AlkP superfamily)
LIPSLVTYDLQPQMSALEMTTAIYEKLAEGKTILFG